MFDIVVAADRQQGIGKTNQLPWRIKKDMIFFKKLTKEIKDPEKYRCNAVIMGRKTWESIPLKHRPLPYRLNIVLTSRPISQIEQREDILQSGLVYTASTLEAALDQVKGNSIETVYVIGGAQVYDQALKHPECHRVYLTRLNCVCICDAFLPENWEDIYHMIDESNIHEESGINFKFQIWERNRL